MELSIPNKATAKISTQNSFTALFGFGMFFLFFIGGASVENWIRFFGISYNEKVVLFYYFVLPLIVLIPLILSRSGEIKTTIEANKNRFLKIAIALGIWVVFEFLFILLKGFRGHVFKYHIIGALTFFLGYLAFSSPTLKKKLVQGILVAWGVLVLLSCLQVFPPFFINLPYPFGGRSSGFSWAPDKNAQGILFSYLVLIYWIPKKYRMPATILTLTGLLTTFSRTELLGFGGAVIFLLLFKVVQFPKTKKQLLTDGAVGLVSIAFLLVSYFNFIPFQHYWNVQYFKGYVSIEATLKEGTQFVTNDSTKDGDINAEPDPNDPKRSYSMDSRFAQMKKGFLLFLDYPALGIPTGDFKGVTGHNAYIYFALSYGLVGWLIIPLLMWAFWKFCGSERGIPFAVAILLLSIGCTDPLLRWTSVLLCAAFLAAESQRTGLDPEPNP